jgi:hypothetical protein
MTSKKEVVPSYEQRSKIKYLFILVELNWSIIPKKKNKQWNKTNFQQENKSKVVEHIAKFGNRKLKTLNLKWRWQHIDMHVCYMVS